MFVFFSKGDASHSLIKLPPLNSKSDSPSQELLPDLRTKDGQHVSPRKLYMACAKLLQTALIKHGVHKDNIHVSLVPADLGITLDLTCGWRAELVPCVAEPGGGDVYYVAK